LSSEELEIIDSQLMQLCSSKFQKVARIVGAFLQQPSTSTEKPADTFIASRIYGLTESGLLEYQGYLGYMRNCEVRLPVTVKQLESQ